MKLLLAAIKSSKEDFITKNRKVITGLKAFDMIDYGIS